MTKTHNQKQKKKRLIKLVYFLIIISVIVYIFFKLDFTPQEKISYGVTFSDKYAQELKLDWQKTYLAILDELKVDNIRLIAYWDEIEGIQDEFDYSKLDWQVAQADDRGVNIMLSVGRRMPRWPECHDPEWLDELAPEAIKVHQLEFVKETILRYKDFSTIKLWQVENEPLFSFFGECPSPDKNFLQQEVDLVHSLDPRPIIITDSGELNHWQGAADVGDVLGITLYRVVWNEFTGFWDYFFIPPSWYYYKAKLTKYFNEHLQDVIVTELQMEPWTTGKDMVDLTYEEQLKSFDLQRFKDNIEYTKRAGFDQVYSWGVEYWYYLKLQDKPQIWEEAKNLWN